LREKYDQASIHDRIAAIKDIEKASFITCLYLRAASLSRTTFRTSAKGSRCHNCLRILQCMRNGSDIFVGFQMVENLERNSEMMTRRGSVKKDVRKEYACLKKAYST
jgi:hypothetical protein